MDIVINDKFVGAVDDSAGKYILEYIAQTNDRIAELEQRIEKAKALVGHKSLDSRRRLMEILEGTDVDE